MIREVAIADCVHFCGFRYGRNEMNPYENYICGLADGKPLAWLRECFIDFVRHYRPQDLGEALGIATSKPIPLWWLPWKSWRKLLHPGGGWQKSPEDVVDIMTYFISSGVEIRRIEKEFFWLERAYLAIRDIGYQPDLFDYIDVFELRGLNDSRFLVIEGNHRLSALHALGHERVRVRQRAFYRACLSRARFWPLVLSGHVPFPDAVAIFKAYFAGNQVPHRAGVPAALLGCGQ